MGKPAARIGDMHLCPMVTPGTPPIPHVGGPIIGPGVTTVIIGGMPAAVMGDMCTCTGPPDPIVLGSVGVFIGGKPAARMGDTCGHGGAITVGCPTVMIGEVMPGAPVVPTPPMIPPMVLDKMEPATAMKATQIAQMKDAADTGIPLAHKASSCPTCAPKL